MKIYAAHSFEFDREIAHSFEAQDWGEAEKIADSRGWTLDGEIEEESEVPDDVLAMIELRITGCSIH